jgi:hypothetical protein
MKSVFLKSWPPRNSFLEFLKSVFLFHLYLIFLTHSAELSSEITITPVNLPIFPNSVFYRKGIEHIFLLDITYLQLIR